MDIIDKVRLQLARWIVPKGYHVQANAIRKKLREARPTFDDFLVDRTERSE